MTERKKRGKSNDSESSRISEEDLNLVQPTKNYLLKLYRKVSKSDQLNVRKKEKSILDSHRNIAVDQSVNKSSQNELPSTFLDGLRSKELAGNTNNSTQEYQEESKRVLTTSRYSNLEDKPRSTIEGASNNLTQDEEKAGKEISVQDYTQGFGKYYPTVIKDTFGIGLSTEGENSFNHPSFNDPSTISKDTTCYNMSPGSRYLQGICFGISNCITKSENVAYHNVSNQNMKLHEDYATQNPSRSSATQFQSISPQSISLQNNYSHDSTTQSKNIAPSNVPTRSINVQDNYPRDGATQSKIIAPHSGLTQRMNLQDSYPRDSPTQSKNIVSSNVPSQNMNMQGDYPRDGATQSRILAPHSGATPKNSQNDLVSLVTSAHSEQSVKHDNATNSLKEKYQSKKNSELEAVAKVEKVVPSTVVLPSESIGNSNDEKNNTDLIEWEMVDADIHKGSTNVDHKNVNLLDFQNQLSSFSREELQDNHNLFVAKGNSLANRLVNLPENLSKEAEEKISHILYEYEVAAYLEKLQMGNFQNSYPFARKSLEVLCKGVSVLPNQKSTSPRKERGGAKSPYSQKIYPQLSDLEQQNGNWEDQGNTEPIDYGRNPRWQPDPEDENQSDEEEFTDDENHSDEQDFSEDIVKQYQYQPRMSPKNIPYVPECEKRHPPPIVTPKQSMKVSSPKPTITYWYVKEILYILGVILIGLTAVIFGPTFWPKILEMLPKTGSPPEPSVATIIDNLKREFSDQPPMTFKIVNSALRRVTELDPKEPAIIVLLAELGAEETAGRFARKVADSVSSPGSLVLISGHTYQSQDPDVAKKDIDVLISENLMEEQLGVVLVDRLDYIPVEAAIIFHTYCDHENAPFKRVVYVMTIASKEKELKKYEPKDWDVMVQDHLYKSWSTGGNDQVSSLLSRLTVSVAAIVSGG